MPRSPLLKPTHKAIQQYYQALASYGAHHVEHEGALETAFQRLLADTAQPYGMTLIPKQKLKVGQANIFPDGNLRDLFTRRGKFAEQRNLVASGIRQRQKLTPKGLYRKAQGRKAHPGFERNQRSRVPRRG